MNVDRVLLSFSSFFVRFVATFVAGDVPVVALVACCTQEPSAVDSNCSLSNSLMIFVTFHLLCAAAAPVVGWSEWPRQSERLQTNVLTVSFFFGPQMRDVLKSPCQCTTHPLLSNSQHYVATPYHCTSTMPRHHEQQQTAYQQRSADQPNDWVTEPVYEELPSGKKMPFPSPHHPSRPSPSVRLV